MEEIFKNYNNIYDKYQFANLTPYNSISDIDIFINNLNNYQTSNKNKNLKNKSINNKYLFLTNELYKFLLYNRNNFTNIIININEKMSYSELFKFFTYIDIRKFKYLDDNVSKDFIELMKIRKEINYVSNRKLKIHIDNFLLKYTSNTPFYQIVI